MQRPTTAVAPVAITPITSITFGRLVSHVPIRIDRFEDGDDAELRAEGQTNAEQVLAFLAANADQAFTPKEVHEATAVARGSVGVVLSRLEDRGLVRHRGEYWAIDPEADLDVTLSSIATARNASDRLGPEDRSDWGPGADEER